MADPVDSDGSAIIAAKKQVDEDLRDVDIEDIKADSNGRRVAAACANAALALLGAGQLEDALRWAFEAQTYDNDNRTAKWCEARARHERDTNVSGNLSRALRLYRDLAGSTGVYADRAQEKLRAGGDTSIQQRYQQQMGKYSNDGKALHKDSRVGNVKGLGGNFYQELARGADTPIRDVLPELKSKGKRVKRIRMLKNLWLLLDDGPSQSDADHGLLERTLRERRGTSKKIISCNVRLMNTLDYKDKIFKGVLCDKARNFARLVVDVGADMFVAQEAPGPGLLQGGKIAAKCVEEETFPTELLRNLGEQWDAKSIDVPKSGERKTRGETTVEVDMGESHLFAYRVDAFRPVPNRGPALLWHVDNDSSGERPVRDARDKALVDALFVVAAAMSKQPGAVTLEAFKQLPLIASLRGDLSDGLNDEEIADAWTNAELALDAAANKAEFTRVWESVDQLSTERFHRPPSWCAFEVLRAGEPTGEHLVIVSVHLKSVEGGDYSRTKKDIRALGRAVAKLQQPGTVVILGDFNAPPHIVLPEFEAVGLSNFNKAINGTTPTNMYRFCSDGADGHVYDGVYSSNPGSVEGGVLTVPDIDAADEEMVRKAQQLTANPGPIMRPVVNGGDAEIVAKDGVPSWLRQKVKDEVYRQWSDHKPIYAKYLCCMASDAAEVQKEVVAEPTAAELPPPAPEPAEVASESAAEPTVSAPAPAVAEEQTPESKED